MITWLSQRLKVIPTLSVTSPRPPRYVWITFLAWLALVTPAQAGIILRVNIQDEVGQIQLGSSTDASVKDGSGRTLGSIPARGAFIAQVNPKGVLLNQWEASQLWIEPANNGYVWIGDRWFRGRAQILPVNNNLMAVNLVDVEQYLYSVLGGEMGGNWPLEALKAQAVASRSYALYKRRAMLASPFDIGDTTTWQVYRGIQDESTGTQSAVNATVGQVLTVQGEIAEAVFHSSSGGSTENSEDIWFAARPYLRSVPDFDQGSPVFKWSQTISSKQMQDSFPGIGEVISITPVRTTSQGRVITMKLTGTTGSRTVSGETLRSTFNLRSTRFSLLPQNTTVHSSADKSVTLPGAFQINGFGFGHGLGMSQWGAYNLALSGYNYQQILGHYYRSTALARLRSN